MPPQTLTGVTKCKHEPTLRTFAAFDNSTSSEAATAPSSKSCMQVCCAYICRPFTIAYDLQRGTQWAAPAPAPCSHTAATCFGPSRGSLPFVRRYFRHAVSIRCHLLSHAGTYLSSSARCRGRSCCPPLPMPCVCSRRRSRRSHACVGSYSRLPPRGGGPVEGGALAVRVFGPGERLLSSSPFERSCITYTQRPELAACFYCVPHAVVSAGWHAANTPVATAPEAVRQFDVSQRPQP